MVAVEYWVAVVKPGKFPYLYEMRGVSEITARSAMRIAAGFCKLDLRNTLPRICLDRREDANTVCTAKLCQAARVTKFASEMPVL